MLVPPLDYAILYNENHGNDNLIQKITRANTALALGVRARSNRQRKRPQFFRNGDDAVPTVEFLDGRVQFP